jgi:phage terminase large subunit
MKYPAWTNGVMWKYDEKDGRRYFIKSRYKVFYGGRSSTKSWTAGQGLVEMADSINCRILCTREVQKSIRDSSKKLIEDTIKRYGLESRFDITQGEIRNTSTGSTFVFHGLKDTDSIKSMEGIDICWIEEGESVTEKSIEDVFPTIRKEGSEIWITFNPKYEDSPIYQMFVVMEPPPRSIVKKINYTDNPFVTRETLEEAEHCKKHFPAKYKHIWLGFPRQSSDDYTVLPIEMLRRCIDAHVKLGEDDGRAFAGLDLAPSENEDGDANSLAIRKGPVLISCEEWKCSDIDEIARHSARGAINHSAKSLIYDAVGVGGFAEKPLKKHAKDALKIIPFMGGAKVFKPDELRVESDGRKIANKDFFSNAKAQQWWNIRDRLENTIALLEGKDVEDREFYISFSSEIEDIDGLLKELSQATYTHDSSGRVKIDKAPSDRYIEVDGKKKKLKSPNRSDAIGYAFASDFCDVELTLFDVL